MSQAKVMVVDDDDIVCLVLSAYIEDEGYAPLLAPSGEEALDALAHAEVRVAVVDIRMPKMDGNAFIIKAHRLRPDLRFIIHSGSSAYHLPQPLRGIGVLPEHVFRKPVLDMDHFGRVLADLAETRG